MIEIDGSYGEGGGQILRTSLALAALSGKALHLFNVRKKRPKPGLMRQHLAAAKAAAEITGGTLEHAELGSGELFFQPGAVRGGEYRFAVGSAGSSVLIAQTVLPVLLFAAEKSRLIIEGGTHAAHAPVFEFFDRVYLPCLWAMGLEVSAALERHGFYPAGGGKIKLEVFPAKNWKRLELAERGSLLSRSSVALYSGIPKQIGIDELAIISEDAPGMKTSAVEVESPGPGNVAYTELRYENIVELFSSCGEIGVSRQQVAKRVKNAALHYEKSGAPVGRYLADQLMLPLALGAGGKFRTAGMSDHTRTNMEVIKRFLPVEFAVTNLKNENFEIEVLK